MCISVLYTDYSVAYSSVGASSDYKGSTCVYVCGYNTSQVVANGSTVNYQGNNATHSSIAIGGVSYDSTKNLLNADRTGTTTGVVFRGPRFYTDCYRGEFRFCCY